jgi:hypothetical protein
MQRDSRSHGNRESLLCFGQIRRKLCRPSGAWERWNVYSDRGCS